MSLLDDFSLTPAQISYVGDGLRRPESVSAERDGTLWASDERGGLSRIDIDGRTHFVAARFRDGIDRNWLPNGFAIAENGDFIIADMTGSVVRMDRSGNAQVILTEVEGKPLGEVNYVYRDKRNRLWLTVQTHSPGIEVFAPGIADGELILWDEQGPRIVAEGIPHPNEMRIDDAGEYLYLAQTTGLNVLRYALDQRGEPGAAEVFGPEQHDSFVDGITLDAEGNLWVVHTGIDRLVVIKPDGSALTLLDDESSHEKGRQLMDAFHQGRVTEQLVEQVGGRVAGLLTSITFCGPDLKTVVLGCLNGSALASFRSPVAGQAMAHW